MAATTDSPRSDLIRLETRPHQLTISHSRTVMVCDRDGMFTQPADGLFIHETRMLAHYHWTVNGRPLNTAEASAVRQNSSLVYAIARPKKRLKDFSNRMRGPDPYGDPTEENIEFRLGTVISDGLHQDADWTNFTIQTQPVTVQLDLDADFADLDEVNTGTRRQKGKLERRLISDGGATVLSWRYRAHHRGQDLDRSVHLRFTGLPAQTRWRWRSGLRRAGGRRHGLQFDIEMKPGERRHVCIDISAEVEGRSLTPFIGCYGLEEMDRREVAFLARAARVSPAPQPQTTFERAVERARQDLSALRMTDLDRGGPDSARPDRPPAWVPAAGIPTYVATFGRDILTAAWQSAVLGPELMRGALLVLRELQGKGNNPWRDEEPGKMLHEAHTGPLDVLNYKPQGRYYGSFNTSPYYIIVLSEYYHWTGDKQAVLHHLEAAQAALNWMERYGHPGHRQFYAFRTRSKQGVKNQGWKDSGDAIIYDDGTIVPDPIAGCPIQGFAYEAKLRMAELLWVAGRTAAAARVLYQAHELKKRFNEAFWMPEENYFAMALDPKGRQVRSIGSDPGDALATGIIAPELVQPLVTRLFSAELFSGWGVRTLSSRHIAFNPYSYHRGSVWPAENAAIGVGLRRYGYTDRLGQLLKAQMEVAERFQFVRLPEVICGHGKGVGQPFPPVYPKSCSPQAWSAGAPLVLLQMVLGIYPYAPFETLFLDPKLPNWLPSLKLEGLRVGGAVVDLQFRRNGAGNSEYEVTRQEGKLRILRQPSPWSVFATPAQRVEDLIDSLRAA